MSYLQDIVDEWLAYESGNLAAGTRTQYRWHLLEGPLCLQRWLIDHNVQSVSEITRSHLVFWRNACAERYAPATLNQAVSAARKLFRWMEAEDAKRPPDQRFGVVGVLHDAIKLPRIPKSPKPTLFPDEYQALMDSFDRSTPKGVRDTAMLAFLYDTGMRSHEFLGLTIHDLELFPDGNGVAFVRSRKGGDVGYTVFGHMCGGYVAQWLQVRETLPGSTITDALWLSVGGGNAGRPLTRDGLRTIMARWSKQAGIRRISPHQIRRGSALYHLKNGTSREWVLRQFGWTDETMYRHYTQALPLVDFEAQVSVVDNLSTNSDSRGHVQLTFWDDAS